MDALNSHLPSQVHHESLRSTYLATKILLRRDGNNTTHVGINHLLSCDHIWSVNFVSEWRNSQSRTDTWGPPLVVAVPVEETSV